MKNWINIASDIWTSDSFDKNFQTNLVNDDENYNQLIENDQTINIHKSHYYCYIAILKDITFTINDCINKAHMKNTYNLP